MIYFNENDKTLLNNLYDLIDEKPDNYNFYKKYTYYLEHSRRSYNNVSYPDSISYYKKLSNYISFEKYVNNYLETSSPIKTEFRKFIEKFTIKIDEKPVFKFMFYKSNAFMVFIRCLYTLNNHKLLNIISKYHYEEYSKSEMINCIKIRHYINLKIMERILEFFNVIGDDLLYYILINCFRTITVYADPLYFMHNLFYYCLHINVHNNEVMTKIKDQLTVFYNKNEYEKDEYEIEDEDDDEDINDDDEDIDDEDVDSMEIQEYDDYDFFDVHCSDKRIVFILNENGFYQTDQDCNRGQFYKDNTGSYYFGDCRKLLEFVKSLQTSEHYMLNIPEYYLK